MTHKDKNSFDVDVKLFIDTKKNRVKAPENSKIDFEYEDGIIEITLPLNPCFYKSLKDK